MTAQRWEDLAARTEGGEVSRGSMFGSRGLRTGRKFFALWWHEQLVVKLPPDRREQLVAGGDAEPFEPMAGRPMNGWVVLTPTADWDTLSAEALTHVQSQS